MLGEKEGRVYACIVTGIESGHVLDEVEIRQDFLFLAGECSGLVLHWGIGRPEAAATD